MSINSNPDIFYHNRTEEEQQQYLQRQQNAKVRQAQLIAKLRAESEEREKRAVSVSALAEGAERAEPLSDKGDIYNIKYLKYKTKYLQLKRSNLK